MYQNVKSVLIKEEEIKKMVKKLGKQISKDYVGKDLVLIGVMKGSLIFLSDLMRSMDVPLEFGTITASSYGSKTISSGDVKIIHDVDVDVENKDVLIVEDLIDTGHTLKYLKEFFTLRKPNSVKICVAFDKPSRRVTNVEIDYKGLDVPDEFIVGYGLDFDEKYRNLPEVCILKDELYQ